MAYFNPDFLQFFKDLAANNHRDWFTANKKRYESVVKDPFKLFVEEMIERMAKEDKRISLEAKDAIFRINRDIRFSKDKTPYKTNVSAIITPGGKKDKTTPGLYFEFGPENVRIYGGVYMLDKDQLYDVRQYICDHASQFQKAISDKDFVKKYEEIRGEKNKVIPKEFRESAENQPLIFNKQFYYFAKLDPEVVLQDDLADILMAYYHASNPVRDFLTKAIS